MRNLINLIANLFNKIKKILFKMNNQDIDRLINLKSTYQGVEFQWVKNYPPNMTGVLSKIIDIEHRGNQLVALFENNQRVSVDQLNQDFYMITQNTPPLSIDEILSINYDPGLSEEIAAQLPKSTTAVNSGPITTNPNSIVTLSHIAQTNNNLSTPVVLATNSNAIPKISGASIFGMFSLTPTKLKLEVEVKLPAMGLLKAMYSESEDKEDFLVKVTEYIFQNIESEMVKESVANKLGKEKIPK